MAPPVVRLAAQTVRDTVRRLVKQSQQLVDRSDALMRETEAALFASQKALRAAMARKL